MVRNLAILCLVASCLSAFVLVEAEVASQEHLRRQKAVWELYWYIDQPHLLPELYDVGNNYSIEANLGSYTNEEAVKNFLDMYKNDFIPRGATFSLFHPVHLEQAIALFRVFYYAKDFETFYKTGAWARNFVNEPLFIYSVSVATFHHPQTSNLRIPPLYEVIPNLFFHDRVIRQAYYAKPYTHSESNGTTEEIILTAEYSKYYQQYNWNTKYPESRYTEDPDVNNIEYFSYLAHPFWASEEEFPQIRKSHGGRYFFGYKLQYARWFMERLSNRLGHVEDFDWNRPIQFGYDSEFTNTNGRPFPHRDESASIPSHSYKSLKEIQRLASIILSAIKMGGFRSRNDTFVPLHGDEGVKILGALIEGSPESPNPRFYGSYDRLAKEILGFSPPPLSKYEVFPSILEHPGINQKDPIYYSLVGKILGFYYEYMMTLPKYTAEKLAFPGVNITAVNVGNITTYFAPHDYTISKGLGVHSAHGTADIKVRQRRLNHELPRLTIDVQSDSNVTAFVHIFLGPKFDERHREIGISENWNDFLPTHGFMFDLKTGNNTIDCSTLGFDLTSDEVDSGTYYKKVVKALAGEEPLEMPKKRFGFPERIIIPKGWAEGFPLQYFVFIFPWDENDVYHNDSPLLGYRTFPNCPLGYPLDREPFPNITRLGNAKLAPVMVYHGK